MTGSMLRDPSPRRRLLPRFIIFGLAIVLVVVALGVRLFDLQGHTVHKDHITCETDKFGEFSCGAHGGSGS